MPDATVTVHPEHWNQLTAELPAPLTDAERAEALRLDALREERGDFSTWQRG